MEIKYKRTYSPARGKRYTAGEIGALMGYALEIADPGAPMKEGRLVPGEICLLLFGITPEEYALKDENPRQLDALADQLLKHRPADRLLGWRIMNLKGETLQRSIQPRVGESIDGGAFARRAAEAARKANAGPVDEKLLEVRRLQQLCVDKAAPETVKLEWAQSKRALGEALLGLEKIYGIRDALLGERWPAIGFDGRIEIFTTRERAENARRQVAAAHANLEFWSIHEIPGREIETYLRRCCEDGWGLIRIDNGFAAAEIQVKDFVEYQTDENARVRGMILQEIAYGTRWQKLKEINAPENLLRIALESTLTFRNFVRREIGGGRFYALCVGGKRENCVLLGRKEEKARMLAVFTTPVRAAALAEQTAPNAVPVEMDFDELASRASTCDGLILDAGMVGYRLPREEFEKAKEMRNKPPMVVRIQNPEKEAAPESVKVPVERNMGSLPNPDDFGVPEESEETAKTADAPVAETMKHEKKGFFKRLFGK